MPATATVIKSYIKDVASLVTSGNVAIEAVEGYWVQLDESDWAQGASAALWAAVNATGLPVLFSAHPSIPNLYAVQYMPEPWGTDKAIVKVRYLNLAPQIVFRSGCGLVTKQTDMDRHGDQIVLVHTPSGATTPIKRPGVITWLCPQSTHAILRTVQDSAYGGINPAQLQKTYVGAINSDEVSVFGINMEPGTLLCENIGADNDGLWGVAWNLQIEFRYDENGHNPEACLINPATGEPYEDLVLDANYGAADPLARVTDDCTANNPAGRKIIDRLRPVDFSPLLEA